MGRVFYNTQYSDYLGENRAILDIVVRNVPDIPSPTPSITPSPTPTPSVTPSATATPTVTPTSTVTPTVTTSPTVTPTLTSSPTPTLTKTPTNTPTPTQSSGPVLDPDASAYLSAIITAGGTLNSTISGATNTLFTSLKSAGLYTKLSYMYPLLGSTPDSMKIEAKSLNATYDIFFAANGGVFNTKGYNPNTGSVYYYARFTNINTNDISSTGNIHIGLYISLAATANNNGYGLCASDSNNANQNYIFTKFNNGNTTYYDFEGGYTKTIADSSGLGHYILTRDSGNTKTQLYRNAINVADVSQSFYPCTTSYFLGTEVNTGAAAGGRNSQTYSFVHFGNRLDSTEQATLSSIINTFQTTLARNTY